MDESRYWDLIRAERTHLAEVLDGLDAKQWQVRSLCSDWSVEEVVAHLSAAANTGGWAWIRNMAVSGFNAAKHNERLLQRYLGEVVVHCQDIARPLGLGLVPDPVGLSSSLLPRYPNR